jgi:hypothetical protein
MQPSIGVEPPEDGHGNHTRFQVGTAQSNHRLRYPPHVSLVKSLQSRGTTFRETAISKTGTTVESCLSRPGSMSACKGKSSE